MQEKVKFSAETRLGQQIESFSIIQKEIGGRLVIYLCEDIYWRQVKNETVKVEVIKDQE